MIIFFAALLLSYGLIILRLAQGIGKLEVLKPDTREAHQGFSLIIPFRNESDHLPKLLECIKKLDYPNEKFEVLLVDDHSEDGSAAMVQGFIDGNPGIQVSLVHNSEMSGSPKKRAIEKAIGLAAHPWIVTTDADCSFGSQWLMALDQMIEENDVKMVVGPVTLSAADSFLTRFQLLDFLSLQGTTMGSFGQRGTGTLIQPFLCNGANFAYDKSAYSEVNGFRGNEQIASGDDVFLLEKMLERYPERVQYLKSGEAIVSTAPMSSWKDLFQQRVRWASKTGAMSSRFGKLLGLLVLLVNFSLLGLMAAAFTGHFSWPLLGLMFLLKFNVDFVLIYRTADVFKQQEALRSYFLSSLIYPLFSVFVALWSLTGRYHWKGRTY